jgi:hypothetical protein
MADKDEPALEPGFDERGWQPAGRNQSAQQDVGVENDPHRLLLSLGPERRAHAGHFFVNEALKLIRIRVRIAGLHVPDCFPQHFAVDSIFHKSRHVGFLAASGSEQRTEGQYQITCLREMAQCQAP